MVESPLPTHKEFKSEGVIVKFPGQAKALKVQRLALPAMESLPAVPGGFHPFRLLINLRLVDAVQPDKEVSVFHPPIEIRVRYTASDLKRAAAAGGSLCLGFWDGTQWNRFTPEKHQFHLESDASPVVGGWGVVNISQWGDPINAWGT